MPKIIRQAPPKAWGWSSIGAGTIASYHRLQKAVRGQKTIAAALAVSAGAHAAVIFQESLLDFAAIANVFIQQHYAVSALATLTALKLGGYLSNRSKLKIEREPLSETAKNFWESRREEALRGARAELVSFQQGKQSDFGFGGFLLRIETARAALSTRHPLPQKMADEYEAQLEELVAKARTKIRETDGPLTSFRKIYQIVAKSKPYRHGRSGQAVLPLVLDGLGSNCEARAKLLLAVAQCAWSAQETAWRLVIAHYSNHVDVLLYHQETGKVYDPRLNEVSRTLPAPLYDPRLFLAASLPDLSENAELLGPSLLVADDTSLQKGRSALILSNTFLTYYPFRKGPAFGIIDSASSVVSFQPRHLLWGGAAFLALTALCETTTAFRPETGERSAYAASCREFSSIYSDTNLDVAAAQNSKESGILLCGPADEYKNHLPWTASMRAKYLLSKALQHLRVAELLPRLARLSRDPDITSSAFLIEGGKLYANRYAHSLRGLDFYLQTLWEINPRELGQPGRDWLSANARLAELKKYLDRADSYWWGPEGFRQMEQLSPAELWGIVGQTMSRSYGVGLTALANAAIVPDSPPRKKTAAKAEIIEIDLVGPSQGTDFSPPAGLSQKPGQTTAAMFLRLLRHHYDWERRYGGLLHPLLYMGLLTKIPADQRAQILTLFLQGELPFYVNQDTKYQEPHFSLDEYSSFGLSLLLARDGYLSSVRRPHSTLIFDVRGNFSPWWALLDRLEQDVAILERDFPQIAPEFKRALTKVFVREVAKLPNLGLSQEERRQITANPFLQSLLQAAE